MHTYNVCLLNVKLENKEFFPCHLLYTLDNTKYFKKMLTNI